MQPLPPEQLIPWVQQTLPEDHRAFEQLVLQYKQFVFTTALRLMGNREDAEDQTQEVFLKVYDAIHQLEQPATFGAWLARMTINSCLNSLKRQRRLRIESLDSVLDAAGDILAGPEQMLPEAASLARELRVCLEEALANLADAERVILVLRDIEDYSYQEIGELLKIGLSAVKMRVHRSRLTFQRLFRRICPGLWHGDVAEV